MELEGFEKRFKRYDMAEKFIFGLITVVFLTGVVIGSIVLASERYDECMKVHPKWYCLSGK